MGSSFLFTFRGPPRRPPPQVQEQVKSLNQSLRLGHLLCRSRNPDFLLNIIQRQVIAMYTLLHTTQLPKSIATSFYCSQYTINMSQNICYYNTMFLGFCCQWCAFCNCSTFSILLRLPLSPCRGWLIWSSPVRGHWMYFQFSACVNSFCTMLRTTVCQ